MLFGVMPEFVDYPVCSMPVAPRDRFLLSTDGVTEPKMPNGNSFGDQRLEQVLLRNQSSSPSKLSEIVLSEIRQWQPASKSQQDDITLVVIDAL